MKYRHFSAPTHLSALHEALYSGALARFDDVSAMRRIVSHAQQFLIDEFAIEEPSTVHCHHRANDLADILSTTQRRYSQSSEVARLWTDLFDQLGYDRTTVARDRLMLRFQPPTQPGSSAGWHRSTATAGFHRDSWGTNLYAQINWWAPVFDLAPDRTLGFFPDLWNLPLANSSEEFDILATIERGRQSPADLVKDDMSPRLLEPLDVTNACPVLIEVGSIIAFSCQHAHIGIGNQTAKTRISLETRTLMIDDHINSNGAPNIDGRGRWMTPGLFRRLSDGTSLSALLGCSPITPFHGPWPSI